MDPINASDATSDCKWLPQDPGFATKAIHAGYKPKDYSFAPVVPSLTLSTTFEQDSPGQHRVYSHWILPKFIQRFIATVTYCWKFPHIGVWLLSCWKPYETPFGNHFSTTWQCEIWVCLFIRMLCHYKRYNFVGQWGPCYLHGWCLRWHRSVVQTNG